MQRILIHILLLSALLFSACSESTELVEQSLPSATEGYSHHCRLNFEGGCPAFDGEGTRASALEWEDGAVIYVHFSEEAYGRGRFDQQAGEWTFEYIGYLADITDHTCQVHYFTKATASNNSKHIITLSSESAVYVDAEASFIYDAATDVLSLKAHLRPQVWRMCFKDMQVDDDVQLQADKNLLYPVTYNPWIGEVSYGASQQTIHYVSDGLSALLYALPVDASIPLKLQSADHQFERQLDGQNIHAGSSGRMHLPRAALHNGWTKSELESETMHRGHEFVDLGLTTDGGLPIYWATCNVGAESPEDYGLYFAWGETEGYGSNTNDGRLFDWKNYKLCRGDNYLLIKYCTDSSFGTVDNKRDLDPEDDAAYTNWGGSWRMPTSAEQDMLREKCTWTLDSSKKGYTVKGPNGNTIFLPEAGYRNGSSIGSVGVCGYYWSSSLGYHDPDLADYLTLSSGRVDSDIDFRNYGHSVRAVCVFP